MPAKTEARSGSQMVPEPTWTVRELADEFAITTRTLRFWEAEGLISPERAGTARIYHARDRARLRLILRGRRFGMTLAECASVIDIYDGAATSERRQLHTLIDRLGVLGRDLQARRDDLERTLTEVTQVTDQCRQRLAELET